MDLQEKFLEHIKRFPIIQPNQKQLIAVSGGVDSVVLCELLFKAGYDFVIAHGNFQLRGPESERDELFVKSLGEKFGKQVLVKRFETEKYAEENNVSIQVAARELRYQWFKSILHEAWQLNDQSIPFRVHYILTAHHANDSIETLLMNFFKGTGIAGLHGILPLQDKIFRPLLFAKKEEILAYARQNNLCYVEDSSNLSDKYTRNFFRHNLFPMLKKVHSNLEDNLLKNIERFSEAEILYKQAVELHKKKLLELKGNEVHIPVLKLKKTTPLSTVLFEIIKDFGFTGSQLKDAQKLLESDTGKYIQSPSHRIIKNRSWLIISPKETNESFHLLIEKDDKKVVFSGGDLKLEIILFDSFQLSAETNVAALDLREIAFPLLLRKWKQGDYFYPLGMKKKKKLSRFFIDQKLSRTDKENIWVIEMNKKIVWIVGQRIDDRFKILPSTKEVLKISWQKK